MKKLIEGLITCCVVNLFPFVTRSIVKTVVVEIEKRLKDAGRAPIPPSAPHRLPASGHIEDLTCS